MQILFFNVKTQEQYPVEVSDTVIQNIDDIRIICGDDVYRPVSTVPDEVRKICTLRKQFEDSEFDAFRQEFNYSKREDVPEDFVKKFSDYIDGLISEKYKEFYELVKDNKEKVYKTLSTHYLTYNFMMNRYDQFQEESRKDKLSDSYALDFAKRLKRLFSEDAWKNEKSISEMSVALERVKQFMDFDDRRHASYDQLLGGVGMISKELTEILTNDVLKDIKEVKINLDDPKYSEAFKRIGAAFKAVDKYYDELITEINSSVQAMKAADPDKLKSYLMVTQKIVTKYLIDTDRYIKAVSATDPEKEKDKLEHIKHEYIGCIDEYYKYLNSIFAAYDTDDRPNDKEREKQFVALWEASMHYRQSTEQDWFITLARLLYKSYIDLFNEVMTDEDKKAFENFGK